jgi:hypothetical protein
VSEVAVEVADAAVRSSGKRVVVEMSSGTREEKATGRQKYMQLKKRSVEKFQDLEPVWATEMNVGNLLDWPRAWVQVDWLHCKQALCCWGNGDPLAEFRAVRDELDDPKDPNCPTANYK